MTILKKVFLSLILSLGLVNIVSATERIKENLKKGHLVILESTTYPGTTKELVLPMLESTGMKSCKDFF